MESHPLNMAHQQHRRADSHFKCKRFDEAIQCHHNAAELLLEAIKTTSSTVALESLTLQHNYHLKQKDLIAIRKEQHNRVKKAVKNLKDNGKSDSSDDSNVQIAIYKVIDETDSLLNILCKKDDSEVKNSDKDPQVVMDEIMLLNRNLHSMVDKLMTQVEVLKDDRNILKDKVAFLENERTKYLNLQMSNFTHSSNFSKISLGTEALQMGQMSLNETPLIEQSSFSLTQPQQPNFDLSAFKDD